MEILLISIYVLVLIYTIGKILLDTQSTSKTLAYILLIIIIPFLGIFFYYAFGINYRHQRAISQGAAAEESFEKAYSREVRDDTQALIRNHHNEIAHFEPLVHFLEGLGKEHLSKNKFELLVNGEIKFPEVLASLKKARHSIHLEYYDWENDTRGNQIKEILLQKVKEGVEVRALYDDYASRGIRKNIIRELKNGGVSIHPKIRVKLNRFANRMNHRDHRKIIIIDGKVGFVGGINISDRYDNSIDTGLYWRDTHVKVTGPLAGSLQRHFIVSYNSSIADNKDQTEILDFRKEFFPEVDIDSSEGIAALGQIVAGGPIYPKSNIMLSYMHIFTLAREKLYVTNPYFIPSESIMNSLIQAAVAGLDVRLMVPEKSDSATVGAAASFYFTELLKAGVRIFLYKKGFVHAKTVVADSRLSVIGTANMDIRSFDLNFEIMSVIYGKEFAKNFEEVFHQDLTECREITLDEWQNISIFRQLKYAIARLVSSFL
ncbi:cardiolipin synthase [Fulvivirga sedimenti]|uniref:Cardiolipin synthase n=1 Tax=Fulvivirga sedimenti TaxID=2879465 RepID=A0A9X1HJY5_9BACT|nr:cardiolipin synthase [Fulvivirga sedimenti]MCA6073470.1 cardiolipin synthase [Fulvivirga sedimenti]